MAAIVFGRTQQAIQTPFEPNRNPGFGGNPQTFTSQDVQNAIEEAKATAPGLASRFVVTAGYAGNAPVNTWLQWFRNNPSNTTPFPIAENSILKSLALAASVSTTCTVEIFNNLVSVASISLTSQAANTVTGLSVNLSPGDLVSARVTSGSIRDAGLFLSGQTTGS